MLYRLGRESRETVITEFVSRPPLCTGGNEAHDALVESSIVKTTGSVREETGSGGQLARGEGLWFSMELLVCGAWPLRGLPFA
jgi:hypothetical protein